MPTTVAGGQWPVVSGARDEPIQADSCGMVARALRRSRRRRGQSVSEYAIVFSVVAAALIGMQLFLKRGLQAKEKSATDYLTSVTGEPLGKASGAIAKTPQFEPYYTAAGAYDTTTDNTQREVMSAKGHVARSAILDTTTRTGTATQGAALAGDDVWQ